MPEATDTDPKMIPEGVEPTLWAEFEQLSERVHDLHRLRDIEEITPAPPTRRMVVDVLEEWFLLFAWIAGRERRRRHGHNGATGNTAERITTFAQVNTKAVSHYLWRTLNNHFHDKLHVLATGDSALLRSEPPKPAAARGGDLDDGLPF